MNCPYCGYELRGNAVFCDNCGTKINRQQNKCEYCGYELRANAKFCDSCGTKVNNATGTEGTAMDDGTGRRKVHGGTERKLIERFIFDSFKDERPKVFVEKVKKRFMILYYVVTTILLLWCNFAAFWQSHGIRGGVFDDLLGFECLFIGFVVVLYWLFPNKKIRKFIINISPALCLIMDILLFG